MKRIKYKKIINIFFEKLKPHLTTQCVCKKNIDEYLTTKTKYVIHSFPGFL